MLTLSGAMKRKDGGGEPLPQVFPQLEHPWKARIRRKEFTQVSAQSGVGKSKLALWMAVRWVVDHNLVGLYFSADSPERVQTVRALSMLNGQSTEKSEAQYRATEFDDLERLQGLEWSFEPDITFDAIEEEIAAFDEKWGATPDFIIMDNLFDVETDAADEWAAVREASRTLAGVGWRTNSAVIGLHHVSDGEYKSVCPSRDRVLGKASVKQSLMLTMGDHDPQRGQPVAVVKHRHGPSDRSGNSAVWIPHNPQTMTFGDIS
ncbi:hypothetical protein EF847_01455 [Actinobacteria bacterium YIM 96077]|uniref:SF4 helicase domain-containing protein n=1 Tax=Phytoactinopolyspora halophila TaxID=1981511 RepID=A0A329QFA5_9ACTN|nr:AAA family ATPase [Phytoactinopolyspora halophila]AYY11587.1 hypothetical protein EF847_01455 [Actinobacteria bacterium YIM 96077]RAW11133.1 hypothetical protein DPM12_17480 [Phytoactinopolyspora halophila]